MKYLIFSVLFFMAGITTAQTGNLDQVELLNGKKYLGLIVEQKPAESVSLWRKEQKDTLTFSMEDIARIVKIYVPEKTADTTSLQQKLTDKASASHILPSPRFNAKNWHTAFAIGTGGGTYPVKTAGFSLLYHFHKYGLSTGLGVHYVGDPNTTNNIPVTVHLGFNPGGMQRTRIGAGLFVETGIALNADDDRYDEITSTNYDYRGGKFIFAGFRLRINATSNAGFWLDGGYSIHTRSTHYDTPDGIGVMMKNNYNMALIRGSLFF